MLKTSWIRLYAIRYNGFPGSIRFYVGMFEDNTFNPRKQDVDFVY